MFGGSVWRHLGNRDFAPPYFPKETGKGIVAKDELKKLRK